MPGVNNFTLPWLCTVGPGENIAGGNKSDVFFSPFESQGLCLNAKSPPFCWCERVFVSGLFDCERGHYRLGAALSNPGVFELSRTIDFSETSSSLCWSNQADSTKSPLFFTFGCKRTWLHPLIYW